MEEREIRSKSLMHSKTISYTIRELFHREIRERMKDSWEFFIVSKMKLAFKKFLLTGLERYVQPDVRFCINKFDWRAWRFCIRSVHKATSATSVARKRYISRCMESFLFLNRMPYVRNSLTWNELRPEGSVLCYLRRINPLGQFRRKYQLVWNRDPRNKKRGGVTRYINWKCIYISATLAVMNWLGDFKISE